MRSALVGRVITTAFHGRPKLKSKEDHGFTVQGTLNVKAHCTTYGRRLQNCIRMNALSEGKAIHAHIIKAEYESDIFLQNQLLSFYAKCQATDYAHQLFDKMSKRNSFSWNNMITGYAKCGRIECARGLFDRMPERDTVSWNAMIAGYALQGRGAEALKLYAQMARAGMKPERITFLSVLGACPSLGDVEEGQQVHAHLIKSGFQSNVFVASALLDMYAKCGSIETARLVFDQVAEPDEVLWNGIIAGYVNNGQSEEALKLMPQLEGSHLMPNQFALASVLKACASLSALECGKQVHCCITRAGFHSNVFLGSALVDMYAKCGNVDYARHVFDKMPERSVVSWNAMVAAYARCGSIACARDMFERMPEREVISWNAIIAGHAQHGYGEEALKLFSEMLRVGMKPERITFAGVLGACAGLAALQEGKQVHAVVVKLGFQSNSFVGSSLVDMYGQCRSMDYACQVFKKIDKEDVVLWNAMLAGYDHNHCEKEAFKLFCQMQRADLQLDHFTFATILSACSNLPALLQGKQVHAHILRNGFESNVFVATALVDMYSKCGSTDTASQLFGKMSKRNRVSWNTMIAGYAQNGQGEDALKLFSQMLCAGLKPGLITFSSVLSACASIAAMQQGKQVHAHIIVTGIQLYVSVGNALITMYAKSGSIDDAIHVFNKMPEHDVISWTAVIAGYAQHGCGKEALQFFEQMQLAGMKPDEITFIGILSACSHAGLVDEGRRCFELMKRDHCITPNADHYACLIDLLGRAGCLDEAENIINSMPSEPDAVVWGALLGACRIHGNMELGKHAAECLFVLDPQNSAGYVLMSNIYAAAGQWNDVANVRKLMKHREVKKKPGCSWIEVNKRLHVFLVEDKSHPQMEEIHAMLDKLAGQMEAAGYVPDTNFVLHDVEEKQKEHVSSTKVKNWPLLLGLSAHPLRHQFL